MIDRSQEETDMRSVKLLGCLAVLLSGSGAMFAQDRELSLDQHPFLTFDVAGHLTACLLYTSDAADE